MLRALTQTELFNTLKQDIVKPSHAYLFYGEDAMLSIELARVFIASIFCQKQACFQCESCRRTEIDKNPDLLIIDKPNMQVADIEGLIDSVQLKPMIYKYKVVLITSADGINETAQNKLLKTLEEPNPQVIFVLVCSNIEKLLPTIRSRLSKRYVPKIDLGLVERELQEQGINISQFSHCDITLTDAVRYSNSSNKDILKAVEDTIYALKSSVDIPNIVSGLKIPTESRKEFLRLLLTAVNDAIVNSNSIFNASLIEYMRSTFSMVVLIKMTKLIDQSIRMIESNVNFNYAIDYLFYNILKEKYLCK